MGGAPALAVLAVPTCFMGGTLPAIARAVEQDQDAGRRRLALLYGVNTLGAVAGAVIATFVLLERLGNRGSVWIAAAINLAVAGLAYLWSGDTAADTDAEAAPAAPTTPAAAPKLEKGKGKSKGTGTSKNWIPAFAGMTTKRKCTSTSTSPHRATSRLTLVFPCPGRPHREAHPPARPRTRHPSTGDPRAGRPAAGTPHRARGADHRQSSPR